MWFELSMRPLEWGPTAPQHFHNEAILDASPDRVFAILADTASWPQWFPKVKYAKWLTEPARVGAHREVAVDLLAVREEFLAWDPGRRFAFTIYAETLPFSHSLVEDYQLEPASGGRTHLVWELHFDVRWFVRPFVGPLRRRYGDMLRGAAESLTAYVRRTAVASPEMPREEQPSI